MPDRSTDKVPVWLMAPVGRDAALLRSGLGRGDGLRVARNPDDLARAFAEAGQVGVLLLTQEALGPEVVDLVKREAAAQPPWSELPIILLVDPVGNTMAAYGALQDTLPRAKIVVLQRPVRLTELETALDAMRRARRRQYRLRDHIREQEALRRELNHRVKNILATVQALYGLTARTSDDLPSFHTVFEPRLRAMALVHDVLFSANYGAADVGSVIRSVLDSGDERVDADGETATVQAEIGQSIGLIIHELAANARHYGALSRSGGRVTVRWRVEDGLALTWSETGGPPPKTPSARGYGMTFVEATVRSLGGTPQFDFSGEGLAFDATIPVPVERQDQARSELP